MRLYKMSQNEKPRDDCEGLSSIAGLLRSTVSSHVTSVNWKRFDRRRSVCQIACHIRADDSCRPL